MKQRNLILGLIYPDRIYLTRKLVYDIMYVMSKKQEVLSSINTPEDLSSEVFWLLQADKKRMLAVNNLNLPPLTQNNILIENWEIYLVYIQRWQTTTVQLSLGKNGIASINNYTVDFKKKVQNEYAWAQWNPTAQAPDTINTQDSLTIIQSLQNQLAALQESIKQWIKKNIEEWMKWTVT